ncbi:uncharacterized protein LOC105914575 [Setaria italica]|uniref:uncharacterized protein LOC105914575 n=1 Tax=Setaria italica TaxID=4555 RepID=UPI0006473A0A|nr:uncharacterized protein LOC105914575 [Setaria italica]
MSTPSTLSSSTSSSYGPQSPSAMGESAGPLFINPYATVVVMSHVPMTLELKNSNFNKWSSFFRSMCGMLGLLAHIDGTAPTYRTDPTWEQADCCIRSWLFGSVSDAVLDLAMDGTDQTSDFSINDYYHRMKIATDALRNVGQPVSEPTLVLNLLRGLTKPYSTTADNIATNSDLTFAAARNQLLLKELR